MLLLTRGSIRIARSVLSVALAGLALAATAAKAAPPPNDRPAPPRVQCEDSRDESRIGCERAPAAANEQPSNRDTNEDPEQTTEFNEATSHVDAAGVPPEGSDARIRQATREAATSVDEDTEAGQEDEESSDHHRDAAAESENAVDTLGDR